jgi:hypothetical protein
LAPCAATVPTRDAYDRRTGRVGRGCVTTCTAPTNRCTGASGSSTLGTGGPSNPVGGYSDDR